MGGVEPIIGPAKTEPLEISQDWHTHSGLTIDSFTWLGCWRMQKSRDSASSAVGTLPSRQLSFHGLRDLNCCASAETRLAVVSSFVQSRVTTCRQQLGGPTVTVERGGELGVALSRFVIGLQSPATRVGLASRILGKHRESRARHCPALSPETVMPTETFQPPPGLLFVFSQAASWPQT
jgi:hypothetical protein